MNELPLHCIVSTHTLDKKCTFSKVHRTSTPMRKYTRPTHNTTLLLRGWKWATLFARRIGKLGSLWCRPFRPRGSSALCCLWKFYWALVPDSFSVRYKEHLWPWLLSANTFEWVFRNFLYCRSQLCPGPVSSPHLFACPRPQVHISHLDPASLSWVGHHVGSTTGGVCLHLDSEERAPRASPVMQNHCKKRTFIGVFGSNYKLNWQ